MPQTRKEVLEAKQCVILKGRRDGISILLDDKADFDLIKDVLRKRVAGSRNFFDGAKSTVTFKGRKLSPGEELILLEIIQFETNLDVGTADTPKEEIAKLVPASPPGVQPLISETFYYKGGIRSGQTIRQNGSVVIIGDINPGAVIKVTGSIVVLGALRGMAWAGAPIDDDCTGSTEAFISATEFKPTQIRIGRVVTYIPKDQQHTNGSWAYINEGQVFIAPL
ncbi:MAG: hypothetical protein FWE11_07160 [Defluviitaleaceae bacterium]|nr:hypothetical protein [Defluviitaleaceae bacterium]